MLGWLSLVKHIMKCLWIALLGFSNFILINAAGRTMGPVGKIIINSVYDCKEKGNGDATAHGELKSIDGKGTKALYATVESKVPIDDKNTFSIEVNKWEGGSWKKFYNYKGKFCTEIQKHIPKLWEKLRKQVKPQIPAPCPVKAGKYVLEGFQAETKDFPIPVIFYGKFHVRASILKDGKLMACLEGEGDSQAPM